MNEKENNGDDDDTISKYFPDIYKYFMWWIPTYGLLYAVYSIRRIYLIIIWTFKDPRTQNARIKVFSILFLNTTEIVLGILGIYYEADIYNALVDKGEDGMLPKYLVLRELLSIFKIAFTWIAINLVLYSLVICLSSCLLVLLCCSGVLDF